MASSKSKSKSKNKKGCSSVKVDRLTSLPQETKEKILTYLPIKEAGKTSILSRKWRYTWTTIPGLKFDDNEINSSSEDMLVRFIDTVLLLHIGPIRIFSLVTKKFCIDESDKWIINLSTNGIREIELQFYDNYIDYCMHSSFFSCLHTLILREITISDQDFEKLVSSSSLLKKLIHNGRDTVDLNIRSATLEHLEIEGNPDGEGFISLQVCAHNLVTAKLDACFADVQIHAPNLESLEMQGTYSDFQLHAPKLSYLYVQLLSPWWDGGKNFARFIGDVPDLKKVRIKKLEDLSIEPWTEEFLQLNHLKNLSLDLNFFREKQYSAVLAIFRRVIHLKTLEIHMGYWSSEGSAMWENADAKQDLFKHLETVRIVNMEALDSTIAFVEFILRAAPHLITLTVIEKLAYRRVEYNLRSQRALERNRMLKLLRFERLSPKAEVILELI